MFMNFKDYYAVLGVERDVSQDELQRAYRKLARRVHPDVSDLLDAESRFKELGEAYDVLCHPGKRAVYDQREAKFKKGDNFSLSTDWDEGLDHPCQEQKGDETHAVSSD